MRGDLGRRYRRVLRLLPGYYRERWEEDMVAAFLDGWLTGDAEADEFINRVARPERAEVASVIGLAARLYLGGAGTPRRYFAWGQAARRAVLAVILVHAVLGVDVLVRGAAGAAGGRRGRAPVVGGGGGGAAAGVPRVILGARGAGR